MTSKCKMPLVVLLALLIAAFSTGSPVFLSAALLIVLLCAASFVAVWHAARTLTISGAMSETIVRRGEDVRLEVRLHHRGWLPVAALAVDVAALPGQADRRLSIAAPPRQELRLLLPCHAAHVGVSCPGVRCVTVTDLFGLFARKVLPDAQGGELVVLPVPFEVGKQTYAAEESGSESMARAAEDITSPADVRAYQQGDPLKRVHWKVTMRKQELMVRHFEAPVIPDALVLMDCSAPPEEAGNTADLQDTLVETAASVMQENIRTEHPARLPLLGEHPLELDKGMGMPAILDALARLRFDAAESFERVLQLEMRRMRKVGCTIVIAARLNSRMVDVMSSMRRMGPMVRLYLVTFTPDDSAMRQLISKLQNADVEVCYVTPMPL